MMEVTVKTLRGSCIISGLSEVLTVAQLQSMLHEQHKGGPLQVPAPAEQRLVYCQEVLPCDAALQQLGVTNGDQLVLLFSRKIRAPPEPQATPAPDAATIRAAITEEARRRGLEHTLREERPAAAGRRTLALPAELLGAADEQLLSLLEQALGGQLLGGLRISGSAHDAGAEEEEEEEEDEIQAPEPSAAHMSQLTDMGFSETIARKALILTRSNIQLALEWLLENSEAPNAANPPTQEQLRHIYGRRRRHRAGTAAAATTAAGGGAGASVAAGAPAVASIPLSNVLSQLTGGSLDAAAAQQALANVAPSLNLAMNMLLGQDSTASAAAAGAVGGRHSVEGTGGSVESSSHSAESIANEGGAGVSSQAAAAAGTTATENNAQAAAGDHAAAANTATDAAEQGADEEAEEFHDDEVEGEEDHDEYEDEEEDDYLTYEDSDAVDVNEEGHALPLHLEQAFGTMGSMDLAELGSADMEQLLQGAAIQDLYGNHVLLAPGGMEAGMGGAQEALLRLMEAPGLLQEMMANVHQPAGGQGGNRAGQGMQAAQSGSGGGARRSTEQQHQDGAGSQEGAAGGSS